MADEDPIPEGQQLENRLKKLVSNFEKESKDILRELREQKLALIDGSEGQPSLQLQISNARDSIKEAVAAILTLHNSLQAASEEGAKPPYLAVPEAVTSILEAKERIDKIEAEVKLYKETLLGDETDLQRAPGIKGEFEDKVKQLTELHSKIFDKPDPNRLALSEEISAFLEDFTKKKTEIEHILIDAGSYRDELLGTEVNGLKLTGIKGDVQEYVFSLDDLLKTNTKKQKELLQKVEDLLEGASTAALATASNEHKKSFDDANKTWTGVFFGSIGIIMAVPLMAVIWPRMLDLPWWEQLLVRLPVVGGAITLAWYAGKQRSQNKRLQQEYAYKEDVAKIYYALKKEIENMGDSKLGHQLKEDVIKLLVKSVDFNPSSTLDSKSHNEGGPMHEGFEKGLDAAKDIAKEVIGKMK